MEEFRRDTVEACSPNFCGQKRKPPIFQRTTLWKHFNFSGLQTRMLCTDLIKVNIRVHVHRLAKLHTRAKLALGGVFWNVTIYEIIFQTLSINSDSLWSLQSIMFATYLLDRMFSCLTKSFKKKRITYLLRCICLFLAFKWCEDDVSFLKRLSGMWH